MITASPKNRILIVEDDAAVRRLMTSHFQKSGFSVEYAMSAEEVASDERYDVVLTDVNLPGESGVDLARRIRATQPNQQVVFMTGDSDPRIARQALQDGAAGYLVKPFEMFEIDAVINNAMRVRTPVQDSGTPMIAHKHVTRPAQVKLRSTSNRRQKRYAMSARVAAVVTFMLVSAFGAGASIKPAKVVEPTAAEEMFGKDSKPIVVPIMMDKTVYMNR